jgi:hypothetical protein
MNRFLHALHKVGHVSKVVGKDTLKVVEIAAPVALPFLPGLGPIAGPIVEKVISDLHSIPQGEDDLNPLEAMAITLVLGMLQNVVKNPQHKAALQIQLLGVADDIYLAYGKVPPQA